MPLPRAKIHSLTLVCLLLLLVPFTALMFPERGRNTDTKGERAETKEGGVRVKEKKEDDEGNNNPKQK